MGTPLGFNYILHSYMDHLGTCLGWDEMKDQKVKEFGLNVEDAWRVLA